MQIGDKTGSRQLPQDQAIVEVLPLGKRARMRFLVWIPALGARTGRSTTRRTPGVEASTALYVPFI